MDRVLVSAYEKNGSKVILRPLLMLAFVIGTIGYVGDIRREIKQQDSPDPKYKIDSGENLKSTFHFIVRRSGEIEFHEINEARITGADIRGVRKSLPASLKGIDGQSELTLSLTPIEYEILSDRLRFSSTEPEYVNENGFYGVRLRGNGEPWVPGNYRIEWKARIFGLISQSNDDNAEGFSIPVLDSPKVNTASLVVKATVPELVPRESVMVGVKFSESSGWTSHKRIALCSGLKFTKDPQTTREPYNICATADSRDEGVTVKLTLNTTVKYNQSLFLRVTWPKGFIHPDESTIEDITDSDES